MELRWIIPVARRISSLTGLLVTTFMSVWSYLVHAQSITWLVLRSSTIKSSSINHANMLYSYVPPTMHAYKHCRRGQSALEWSHNGHHRSMLTNEARSLRSESRHAWLMNNLSNRLQAVVVTINTWARSRIRRLRWTQHFTAANSIFQTHMYRHGQEQEITGGLDQKKASRDKIK